MDIQLGTWESARAAAVGAGDASTQNGKDASTAVQRPRILPVLASLAPLAPLVPSTSPPSTAHTHSPSTSTPTPTTTVPPPRIPGSGSPFMGRRGLQVGLSRAANASSSVSAVPSEPVSPSRSSSTTSAVPPCSGTAGGSSDASRSFTTSSTAPPPPSPHISASHPKIKTNGSLPRHHAAAHEEPSTVTASLPRYNSPEPLVVAVSEHPSAPVTHQEVSEYMDGESPASVPIPGAAGPSPGARSEPAPMKSRGSAPPTATSAALTLAGSGMSGYSLDALDIFHYNLAPPPQPAVALRRQMSLRVTSSHLPLTPDSVSGRRFAHCLQCIAELKRQLQELDVQQSEMVMELDLERALLQEECQRVLHTSQSQSNTTSRHPAHLSSAAAELGQLKSSLQALETDLSSGQRRLRMLQQQQGDAWETADAVAVLREELESKRRHYENLEYRILEAELALEEEHNGEVLEGGGVVESREVLVLNAQMKALYDETQRQTDRLSARRRLLLEQLQAQYAVLQRINDHPVSQSSRTLPGRSREVSREVPIILDTPATSSQVSPASVADPVPLRINRPLTRYLPQWDKEVDLEEYLESCGHNLELCGQFVQLTAGSLAGWLSKLCGRFAIYRKRWFRLDCRQRTLTYAKSKSQRAGRVVLGFEHIEDVFVVHDDAGSGKRGEPGSPGRGASTFCLATLQRRFYLRAPNAAVMRLWVEALSIGAEGSTSDYWQNA